MNTRLENSDCGSLYKPSNWHRLSEMGLKISVERIWLVLLVGLPDPFNLKIMDIEHSGNAIIKDQNKNNRHKERKNWKCFNRKELQSNKIYKKKDPLVSAALNKVFIS